jgi:hypothetical protein
MEGTWGLLGPEFLPKTRRIRSLGLGASVRSFNDLAVPGLGGVWYGKQFLLASLGVAVAEDARARGAKVQNIEVANAIEALACWMAFNGNGWSRDARLRGNTKLHGKNDFSFRRVRQRNFYVTQPMRMATVLSLPALGFVESDSKRFNGFRCSVAGRGFVEIATEGYRPYNRTVVDHLTWWAQMKDDRVDTNALRQALSPLNRLSDEAIPLLRERLIQGGNESREDKERRGNALSWVETLRTNGSGELTWDQRPQVISENHWRDLKVGALFFEAREAAIATLDALEIHIGNQTSGQSSTLGQIPRILESKIENLKSAANNYLAFNHTDEEANKFCSECINIDPSSILRSLVKRDEQVLRLVGDEVKPGPAFRGSANQTSAEDGEDVDTPQAENNPLPKGISYRMRNLYLLNLDMRGELDAWLKPTAKGIDV